MHGHFAAYAACAASDLELLASDALRWYERDERAWGFCGECGSSLFWRAAGRDTVSIAAGTIDQPTGLTTTAQIFTADRGDYYVLPDEGEQFPGERPGYGDSG